MAEHWLNALKGAPHKGAQLVPDRVVSMDEIRKSIEEQCRRNTRITELLASEPRIDRMTCGPFVAPEDVVRRPVTWDRGVVPVLVTSAPREFAWGDTVVVDELVSA